MSNLLLIGCSNWLGREIIDKLLQEKDTIIINSIDNLSSEFSSRQSSENYRYLDTFTFTYMDINNYNKVKELINKDTIIIYNIWKEPDSIKGIYNIVNICKEKGYKKLIYRTNKELISNFKSICSNLNNTIGIVYTGEVIGNYDINNKMDIKDTYVYYRKIGNKIVFKKGYDYYNMVDVASFIYFLMYFENSEPMCISQPTQYYKEI